MTPSSYYQQKCQEAVITEDAEQLKVLKKLENLYEHLIEEQSKRSSWLSFLRKKRLVKGLYLWGGVGVGKTFLMDCFFHTLPFPNKMRMHFHSFMQQTHNELTKLQGRKDPLQIIAKQWAKDILVLCFDEFYVSDITDAMILGRLLKLFFEEGVSLVMTSNIAPDDLYRNGLQREQFIPAIKLIKLDTDVHHITTAIDYRLRHLKKAGVFYSPLGKIAEEKMENSFSVLTQGDVIETSPFYLYDRELPVRKRTEKVIWFDFQDICSVPRSQKDYLALAQKFQTVFISDVPVLPENDRDRICLFISMIDVFYDARVRLVISAAESIEKLYYQGYMTLEFTRTHSRLLEMQSEDYFIGENKG